MGLVFCAASGPIVTSGCYVIPMADDDKIDKLSEKQCRNNIVGGSTPNTPELLTLKKRVLLRLLTMYGRYSTLC